MGRPLGDGRIETRSGVVVTYGELQRAKRARLASRTADQIIGARNLRHPDGLKRCNKCGRAQPFHHFADKPSERDGLNPRCFGCLPVSGGARNVG